MKSFFVNLRVFHAKSYKKYYSQTTELRYLAMQFNYIHWEIDLFSKPMQ
jgi:hypothetical protein